MTLKAYLDNIQANTGKTPKDFKDLAEKKGLLQDGVKTGEIVAWLKKDFGLGHGHAMAIVHTMKSTTEPKVSKDDKIARHFSGKKSKWRKPYDGLIDNIKQFGSDVTVSPTNSYISILRKGKKFAIVQITTDRLDIGIKLKGIPAKGRLLNAGTWNNMVTHRVRIADVKELNDEVIIWLNQAYDAT
jgi:hypothetical protein